VPTDQTTVILALDVSHSMCLNDIQPTRLQSAEAAALSFVRRLEARTQIGVVAFSGFTELIQAPTRDPRLLQTAIQSLTLGSTTAIGSGILESLEAIAQAHPDLVPSLYRQGSSLPAQSAPAPKGAHVPAIIILLTDGINNTGPDPLDAAQVAADRGVRVFTIGFGTEEGEKLPECPQQGQSSQPGEGVPFIFQPGGKTHGTSAEFRDNEIFFLPYSGAGGGSGGSSGYPRGIDEEALEQIAALTGGAYYPAESASQLRNVFKELSSQLITQRAIGELSVAFAALGAFLTGLALILSMVWNPL
jgi:Ca-activated chloride channel family protein